MDNIERYKTDSYRKNYNLEFLLKEINTIIAQKKNHNIEIIHDWPILFIVGTPRSGTTLLTQWLADLNLFSFPTNFVSRFYSNPYFGYLVQEMLFNKDFAYKNELNLITKNEDFKSDVGKTKGALAPHEFWYFWREHFTFTDIPIANSEFMQRANFKTFENEIHKIQSFYKRPFFLKSLIINWYIESFYKNIKKPIFLYIKRNVLDNAQSLLDIRKRYLGNEDLWFSFKPLGFDKLEKQNNYTQVVGQVEFTNRDIELQLQSIPEKNKIEIDYEKFCINPSAYYKQLKDKLNLYDVSLPDACPSNDNFSQSLSKRSHSMELRDAYKQVQLLK